MRSLEARYPAGRALPVTELYLRQKQQQLVLPLGEEEEVAPRAASFLMEKPGTAAGATPGPASGRGGARKAGRPGGGSALFVLLYKAV